MVAERASLSPDRRCVTNVWAGRRRMWPMFNKEYFHALKISHEDLPELLPEIEAVEKLVQPKGRDDNGRAGGSIIALLREQADINVSSTSTASDETYANISDWIHRYSWILAPRAAPQSYLSAALKPYTKEKYMTLSHRWGDSNIPTLTTNTIIPWAQELSIKILPKTFQDFIILAQRLQVRYVWIDSLCIIQQGDDGNDWRIEALTMDQVYMNSYCNVSADWGSPKRGLYFQRDLRMIDKPNIDWRVKRQRNPDVVAVEECVMVENEFWEDQISRSPLSIRGWVVQERWLCPRNLRFGPREVFSSVVRPHYPRDSRRLFRNLF
ncbi:hypothetical protein TrVFT333_002542 [Trichoderma virens FT-333]|nr:hypothetical protein TrVFT333_002542 [Trichoderma virens FT-333]